MTKTLITNIRLEATEGEDTYKMWMTDDDLDQLRRATVSYRDDGCSNWADSSGCAPSRSPRLSQRTSAKPTPTITVTGCPEGRTPPDRAGSPETRTSPRMSSGLSGSTKTPRTSPPTNPSSTTLSSPPGFTGNALRELIGDPERRFNRIGREFPYNPEQPRKIPRGIRFPHQGHEQEFF